MNAHTTESEEERKKEKEDTDEPMDHEVNNNVNENDGGEPSEGQEGETELETANNERRDSEGNTATTEEEDNNMATDQDGGEEIKKEKEKASDLFQLVIVNSYGSQEVKRLEDNPEKTLKLSSKLQS